MEAYDGIGLGSIFVSQDGHGVGLGNHSTINSCHVLLRKLATHYKFEPDQSSFMPLLVVGEEGQKVVNPGQRTCPRSCLTR